MPDISMCMYDECEARKRCHRHAESGTKPSNPWQTYGRFPGMGTPDCEGFWPKREGDAPPKKDRPND